MEKPSINPTMWIASLPFLEELEDFLLDDFLLEELFSDVDFFSDEELFADEELFTDELLLGPTGISVSDATVVIQVTSSITRKPCSDDIAGTNLSKRFVVVVEAVLLTFSPLPPFNTQTICSILDASKFLFIPQSSCLS